MMQRQSVARQPIAHRCHLLQSKIVSWSSLVCRGTLTTIRASRNAVQTRSARGHKEQGELIVVVGAGAAGLTAAFFAAQAGARVIVLERMKEAGKKILMSGGSRCNVLPMHVDLQRDFFTEGSRTSLKAIFASWSLPRCKEWLEEDVGLALGEEVETCKVFPLSNSSREVRDKLLDACRRQGVEVRFNASLEGLRALRGPQQALDSGPASDHGSSRSAESMHGSSSSSSSSRNEGMPSTAGSTDEVVEAGVSSMADDVHSEHGLSSADGMSEREQWDSGRQRWLCRLGGEGGELEADKLIICTGGMSFPAVGTDGTGHRLLAGLGQELVPTYPALTPLLGTHPAHHQLAGLSMYEVEMWAEPSTQQGSCQALPRAPVPVKKMLLKSQRNSLLFTHKGYSGPAVLDLSHVAIMAMLRSEALPTLRVNWTGHTPSAWDERLKVGGTAFVSTVLQRSGIRERLAAAIVEELQLQDRKMSQLSRSERAALVSLLTGYELKCSGHEGYKKAEVTGGGVPLSQIDCTTMESKLLPGMFLAGEICDVFGRIGGFNFYWAWVSGRLAGLGAARPRTGDQAPKKKVTKRRGPG